MSQPLRHSHVSIINIVAAADRPDHAERAARFHLPCTAATLEGLSSKVEYPITIAIPLTLHTIRAIAQPLLQGRGHYDARTQREKIFTFSSSPRPIVESSRHLEKA